MAKFYCFSTLLAGKKKKLKKEIVANENQDNKSRELQMKPAKFFEFSDKNSIKEAAFNVNVPVVNDSKDENKESLPFNEKLHGKTVMEVQGRHDKKIVGFGSLDEAEGAYEGSDEHEETSSMRRDFSDLDLQAQVGTRGSSNSDKPEENLSMSKFKTDGENSVGELINQSGHVSDPGVVRTISFCGSPKFKRSCSNIETGITDGLSLSPSKSLSYDDLRNIKSVERGEFSFGAQNSPLSVTSSCSVDKIMLKKRSSSQVLPSRSRKLWWKLLLWRHRNLHRSLVSKPRRLFPIGETLNQKGGYTSDTLEPNNSSNEQICTDEKNQWVAFSMETSPFDRVDAWVNALNDLNLSDNVDDDDNNESQEQDLAFATSHEVGESSQKHIARGGRHIPEEVIQANNIMQSLNSLSSAAHICSMGLKVLPAISAFSSLRSINLSNNCIVHVTPGALPKSLHSLDLSRNKITTIEGLRELTRLRVLNMSYNRISRIGHGLSNCPLIKELYLAGNRISNVEGLHRLLKLNLLDLSFNKITTAKSLGQLVANYNSLLALNLLGNPIQSNVGDDQLRKTVISLLPNLTYLNKQPIKPQRATEVVTDSIARAALSDGGSRRRMVRRANVGSSGSSSFRGRIIESSSHRNPGGSKRSNRSKSRH